jgi:Na+(H+)/acetate symporter ActP
MINRKYRCGHLGAMSTMSFFIQEPDRIKELFTIPDIIAQRRYRGLIPFLTALYG